jgi:hypothetical protein
MHALRATRPLAAAVLAGAMGAAVVLAAGCAGSAPAAVSHAPAPTGSLVPAPTGSLVPAPTGSPVPSPAVPRLAAIADRAARANGDPAPSQVTAVLTTRAKALTSATPGDFVPGSGGVPVFLVTLRGHFTAADVSRPPGSAAPTGRYLSLVVDAATFQVTDFGISPAPPPVSPASLGPVTYLDP